MSPIEILGGTDKGFNTGASPGWAPMTKKKNHNIQLKQIIL